MASPQLIQNVKENIVKNIWAASKIEIPLITFPQTEDIYNGYTPNSMSEKDIVIVNNIKHAWQFLIDNHDVTPDWQYAKHYNYLIGDGVNLYPGEIRQHTVQISGTNYIPPIPQLDDIYAGFETAYKYGSVEQQAAALFAIVCRGQWFSDGNKRTAHLLANQVMLAGDAGMFLLPQDKDEDFRNNLLRYYDSGELDEFVSWLTDTSCVR